MKNIKYIVIIMLLFGCKEETTINSIDDFETTEFVDAFFENDVSEPSLEFSITYIKTINDESNYANTICKKYGKPLWNLYDSFYSENSSEFLIPLIKEEDKKVNSIMVINIKEKTLRYGVIIKKDFPNKEEFWQFDYLTQKVFGIQEDQIFEEKNQITANQDIQKSPVISPFSQECRTVRAYINGYYKGSFERCGYAFLNEDFGKGLHDFGSDGDIDIDRGGGGGGGGYLGGGGAGTGNSNTLMDSDNNTIVKNSLDKPIEKKDWNKLTNQQIVDHIIKYLNSIKEQSNNSGKYWWDINEAFKNIPANTSANGIEGKMKFNGETFIIRIVFTNTWNNNKLQTYGKTSQSSFPFNGRNWWRYSYSVINGKSGLHNGQLFILVENKGMNSFDKFNDK